MNCEEYSSFDGVSSDFGKDTPESMQNLGTNSQNNII